MTQAGADPWRPPTSGGGAAIARAARALGAGLLLALLTACAAAPVGGPTRPNFNPYWLRTDTGLHPLSLFALHEDARLHAYVRSIADRLAASEPGIEPGDFEIELVDAGVVNAQVYRGKTLSITLGLLALMADEAELASVIAHELAHIAAKDEPMPRRFQGTGPTQEAAREAAGRVAAAYSRERELEADRRGQQMMAAAGYDIGAMASAMSRLGVGARKVAFSVTEDQSSHPFGAVRLASLAPSTGGARRREAYLAAIDGLPFRPPDLFAIEAEGAMLSLDHRLVMAIPPGFVGRSGTSSVSLKNARGDVTMLMMVRPRSPLGLEEALREGLYPIMVRDFPLGVLGAVQPYESFGGRKGVNGSIRSERRRAGPLDLELMAIDDGRRRFFGLAAAPATTPSQAFAAWRDFESGVRPMTSAEAARLGAKRLVVTRIRPGETIADHAEAFGGGDDGAALFRRLNGLAEDATLTPGQQVKSLKTAR